MSVKRTYEDINMTISPVVSSILAGPCSLLVDVVAVSVFCLEGVEVALGASARSDTAVEDTAAEANSSLPPITE